MVVCSVEPKVDSSQFFPTVKYQLWCEPRTSFKIYLQQNKKIRKTFIYGVWSTEFSTENQRNLISFFLFNFRLLTFKWYSLLSISLTMLFFLKSDFRVFIFFSFCHKISCMNFFSDCFPQFLPPNISIETLSSSTSNPNRIPKILWRALLSLLFNKTKQKTRI